MEWELLVAVNDSTLREVVRSQFDGDLVSGQNADVIHADLSRDVGKDGMAFVLIANQFDSEGGIGKTF